jgi:hypothetical protein
VYFTLCAVGVQHGTAFLFMGTRASKKNASKIHARPSLDQMMRVHLASPAAV